MRWLRPSSEAEMVALFLRTELPAARFRDTLRALLQSHGLPESVITTPDLGDDAENQARLRLLTEHREYGTRTGLLAEERRFELLRGCPQHASNNAGQRSPASATVRELRKHDPGDHG